MSGAVPRVGINLPQFEIDFVSGRTGASALLGYAKLCEELGFDSVWLADHVFARAPDGTLSRGLEPGAALAAVAGATGSIGVGTLVLDVSLRGPAQVTATAAALEAVATGRVTLGLGCGWNPHTHRALGLPLPPYAERCAALASAVASVARLPRRPRVLVGGWGDPVLAAAAAGADVANVAWDVPPDAFRRVSRRLDAACESVGRDPATLVRSVGLTILCAPDAATSRALVSSVARRAPFLAGLTPESVREAVAVTGTPSECAARLAAYRADEIVLSPFVRDDPDLVRLIAEEVVPALAR